MELGSQLDTSSRLQHRLWLDMLSTWPRKELGEVGGEPMVLVQLSFTASGLGVHFRTELGSVIDAALQEELE